MKKERVVTTIPYTGAAESVIRDLPRDRPLHGINLRLSATDTLSGGTQSGSVLTDGLAFLLPSIRLVARGDFHVKNYPAQVPYHAARLYDGVAPEYTPWASGDAGAHAIALSVPIECALKRSAIWSATLLDVRRFSNWQLHVDFAAPTAGFDGTHDRTHAITGGALEVSYIEEDGFPNVALPNLVFAESVISYAAAAATTGFRFELPTGKVYKRQLLHTWTTATGRSAGINTGATNLDLRAGNVSFWNGSFLGLRGDNKRAFQQETLATGWACIENDRRGDGTGVLDVRGVSSYEIVMDLAAGATIEVCSGCMVPYPG